MLSMKEVILLGLAMGSVSAYVAIRKKKNPFTWFLVGFFFGVPGIIFNFFTPFKKKPSFQKPTFPGFRKSPPKSPSIPEKIDRRLWYYLDQQNKQYGPMSINALKEEWKIRQIGPHTLVWNDELESWKKINQLSDFEELFYGKSYGGSKKAYEKKITS